MGLKLDVTQVLKHFGVPTQLNMAARDQKLVKLVPVPMSDKCPYVRQIVPMSDKNVTMSDKNAPMSDKMSLCPTRNVAKVKRAAGGRRSQRV